MMRSRATGILLIVVSAVAFGATAIFARFAYAAGADTYTLLFLRFAIASVVLLFIMGIRRAPLPPRAILVKLALLGGILRVGQGLTYFIGLTLTTASLMSLLLYLYPSLVALLAAIFLGAHLTTRSIGAILLALVGTTITIGPTGHVSSLGVIMGLSTAVIYAAYILLSSRVTAEAGAITSATVIGVAAAVVFGCIAALHGVHLPRTIGGWLAILAIALISTVLGTLTFFAGMQRVGPTDASTLSTLEPAVTVGLAAAFLGERLAPAQLFGGVLILAAVLLLTRATMRTKPIEAIADP